MRACNRGEMLTRSVQENAANRTDATRTRAQVCERPELFIGLGACDNGEVCASNFRGGGAPRVRAPYVTRFSLRSLFFERSTRKSCRFSPLASARRRDVGRVRKFSPLRGRGPFPPIWCSRSIGPDLTGPGSNGDVQNDASTRESCRDQTAVLSS